MGPGEPRLRGVLFDAAGTLIRTREPVGESYARVAGAWGVALPAWRLSDAFARILAGSPPRVFPEAGSRAEVEACERRWWHEVVRGTVLATDDTVRFDDFDGFFDALFEHFAGAQAWSLMPGAVSALGDLRERGLKTGVLSNFDYRLPKILEELGIEELLDAVVLPVDCGAAKPDARIFRSALAALELPAEAVAYVGDDAVLDIDAARVVGLVAVDVNAIPALAELPTWLPGLATLPTP